MKSVFFFVLTLSAATLVLSACEDPIVGQWEATRAFGGGLPVQNEAAQLYYGDSTCDYYIHGVTLEVGVNFAGRLYFDTTASCETETRFEEVAPLTVERWHQAYELSLTYTLPIITLDCARDGDTLSCSDIYDLAWMFERKGD